MAAIAPELQAPPAEHAERFERVSRERSSSPDATIPAKQFAVEVARMLADTRCHQVVVLDVTGISPVTDFLVLASGTSPRQMKSASDAAEEFGGTVGYRPLRRVGESAQWVVLDFFDVVVHVFSQDARHYYDLDNLWGDARRVEWERPSQIAPAHDVH